MSHPALLNASIGDYRLVEFVGAGGMGEVYRAVHAKIGRTAAVKILTAAPPGSDFVQRFLNEARLHASLQHPNIATLYDFLEVGGRPCIIMEYVDGQTLSDLIRLQGSLQPAEAFRIFTAIVSAVSYVHDQGIVHRDLKTANVRLRSQGVVKLLDFGIAKSEATPQFTLAGNVIGTLMYLAPEQLRGDPATTRSDVWALGIVLYEMLTGTTPFDAPNLPDLMDRIRTGNYKPVSSLRTADDRAEQSTLKRVDKIVANCLRRDPDNRYADARAMLEEATQRTVVPRKSTPAPEVVTTDDATPPAVVGALARYWPHLAVTALIVLLAVAYLAFRSPAAPENGSQAVNSAVPADNSLPAYRIEVAEGTADVYINGALAGRTPYEYHARTHETVTLDLKQPGFADFRRTFDITERKIWTLAMTRLP